MKSTRQLFAARRRRLRRSSGAHAQAAEEIKVSYQPALYWALPFYIATEKNWWGELGLKPAFSTFPAGVPQIAASASKSWDVGGTGSVPAVLGAVRFNLLTIGITNDESQGNALLARGDKAAAVHGEPRVDEGPDDPADRQLDRRLRGAVLPRQVRPQEGRRHPQEHGTGRDHLGDVVQQRRAGRRVGAEHLHAGGEGRRQDDLHGQGRRRDRSRRADRARRLRQGEAAERGQVPRRLPARAEVGERQPQGSDRDDAEVLRAGRSHDLRRRDEQGVRHAAHARPRRAARRAESQRRAPRRPTAGSPGSATS